MVKGPFVLPLIWSACFDSILIDSAVLGLSMPSWPSDLRRVRDYVRPLQSMRAPRAWEVTPGGQEGGISLDTSLTLKWRLCWGWFLCSLPSQPSVEPHSPAPLLSGTTFFAICSLLPCTKSKHHLAKHSRQVSEPRGPLYSLTLPWSLRL